MENALLRGRARHPCVIGEDGVVGPHAQGNGAGVGNGCFLATGAALFPACVLGEGAEVRIHGVVQVNTVLPPGATVPIGWVAVGDPAEILPPGRHEQIWAIQESLDFPGTVYGVARGTPAAERMSRQAAWYAAHPGDRPAGWSGPLPPLSAAVGVSPLIAGAGRPSEPILKIGDANGRPSRAGAYAKGR